MTSRIESLPSSTIASRSMPEAEPSGRAACRRRAPRRSRDRPARPRHCRRAPSCSCIAKRDACSWESLISVKALPSSIPPDEELEALDDRRSSAVGTRERRELDRVVVEDRRLDQLAARPRATAPGRRAAPRCGPGRCRRRAPPAARAAQPRPGSKAPCSRAPSTRLTRSQRARSTVVAPELRHVVPSVSAATSLDDPLHARHRVAVVGVGLVPLEHRELGVVLVGDAFVAEVLADLVDPLEPADDQALEVELGRDPQVEPLVELVVVGLERARERAAVAGLEDRRLDLDEAGARRGRRGTRPPCASATGSRARVSSFISRSR